MKQIWYCIIKYHKQLEMNECILSIVANSALMLKHQAISTHIVDHIFIAFNKFHMKILNLLWPTIKNIITF